MTRRPTPFDLRSVQGYPVVVLVSSVDRRILPALRFVSRLPLAQPRALHISVDPDETRRVAADWMKLDLSWLPLHIRDAAPNLGIAQAVQLVLTEEGPVGPPITVVVPELTFPRWWHPLLHRQSARRIAAALQGCPTLLPVIVPFALPSGAPRRAPVGQLSSS